MSRLPSHARVVIVGAGIVGNSLSWHLAKLGWRDIVLLDKGPLQNPGGSTSHASSFTFPIEYSRQMVEWCMAAIRQFNDLGTFTEAGGIEIARTEARMTELKRRHEAALAFGVDSELVTPAEIERLVPWMDTRLIVGGFHIPCVGVADPLYAGTLMRKEAGDLRALTAFGMTEVTGIDVRDGRVEGVRTGEGRHSGGNGGGLRRGLERAPRQDGRRLDPAYPGGPSDDQYRARPSVLRADGCDQLPGHP